METLSIADETEDLALLANTLTQAESMQEALVSM